MDLPTNNNYVTNELMKKKQRKNYSIKPAAKEKIPHEVKEHHEPYSILKGKDVNELADNILHILGEDRQKRATLVGLLVSDVATKQEFTAVLNELRATREASERRFESIESELKAMREASDRKFEASERRFETIETELRAMREASERRFESIESELKAMREASERRFESIESELKAMREASERRFESIESELKAMREASDRKFEEMRESSDRKFEVIEKRFEAIDKRFEEQRQDFHLEIQAMDRRMQSIEKSLSSKIDALGSRWGIMAEDTFSNALREVVSKAGFAVSKWKKTDTNAEFFVRPRDVEIDILVRNGKRIAIEVKSSLDINDVEAFEKTVRFYEKSESAKIDEKIMVGMFLRPRVSEYADQLGIKIVSRIEDVVQQSP